MKHLLITALFLLALPLFADDVLVHYKVELDQAFLKENDSLQLVFHHGVYFKRFKAKKGKKIILELKYLIPCRSGLSRTAAYRALERSRINGTTYNIYYEGSGDLVSVGSIGNAVAESRLDRKVVHFIKYDEELISDFERKQFDDLYQPHAAALSKFSNTILRGCLQVDMCSKSFSLLIRQIDWKGFTAAEFNDMFSMNLPTNGFVEFELYRGGQVYTKVGVSVRTGYIRSLQPGSYIYGKVE